MGLFPDEPDPEEVKRVDVTVPWTAALPALWSCSPFSPRLLLSLPARLLASSSPPLWVLSVCLAEIEKHKGDPAVPSQNFELLHRCWL